MSYKIKLNKREKAKLEELLSNERNTKIWRRLKCLKLIDEGYTRQEAAEFFEVTRDTITDWNKQYLEEGLEGICKLKYEGRRAVQLDQYKAEIEAHIKAGPIATLGELCQWVREQFGVECSETWMSKWLKKSLIVPTKRRD